MRRSSGRLVRLLPLAALGVALASSGPAHAAATTSTMPLPVDRQDYVAAGTTTDPSSGAIVDAYDGDPSSIHVAINGGQEFARSFVHIPLDYLPDGAVAEQGTLTVHVTAQSDASNTGTYPTYNVNTSAAIIEACALTTELPADFNYQQPPAYDCQHASAIGKPDAAYDRWTFPLNQLLAYWRQHGDTGAALIPIGSGDPSQTWGVAFYKSRSAASVTYRVPSGVAPVSAGAGAAGSTTGAAPPPAAGPGTAAGTGTTTASGPTGAGPAPALPAGSLPSTPSVVASAPAAGGQQPALAGTPVTGTPVATVHHASGGVTSWWPAVLLGCLALTGAALAVAHRDAVGRFLARIGPPTVGAFRAHPRAYSVAAVATVWGLVFTGYSLVVAPATSAGSQTTVASGQYTAGGGSTTSGGSTGGVALAAGGSSTRTGGVASSTGAVNATTVGTTTGTGPVATTCCLRTPNPAATETAGPGTWRTINGVPVFFPANGGPPVAKLYSGADDTIGISPSTIKLCAHAALTYGSAFNISASDLNVYWDWRNAHGGILGRTVDATYQNDNYDPGTAVQAAQACKDWGTFFLIGGIGFDQIPAVRQWAEQNHELYYHHVATIEGTQGLRYSFSPLPTVEQLGTYFGQLAVQQFRGKKIGILYRNSSNWSPGVQTFTQVVKAAGMDIVGSYPVTINQGNYTQEITQLNAAGAQVVLAWENALGTVEMIKQAQGQSYHPAWLIFPFNLITNTLGSSSLDQPLWGAAAWDGYDPGYYGGGFAAYASEIHEFEAEYHQYDPNAQLSGSGGDLLFLNWEAQRQVADMLVLCGQNCTRNKLAGIMLAGYDRTVPPNCNINFGRTSDHHHGGYLVTEMHDVRDPNGRSNFVPVERCVPQI